MKNDNLTYQKAFSFAVRIVRLNNYLVRQKREFTLGKQVLRSGTSIGANVAEANGAISKADFSSKISIAYKESLETKYWLSLLKDADLISVAQYQSMFQDADEISRILFSILRKTRLQK